MAIVGDVPDNGESWTTKCAIDKRVSISKVLRGKKFGETLVTGRYIRRDEDKFLLDFLALSDFKCGIAQGFEVLYIERLNLG
jgi:hypothetical protein